MIRLALLSSLLLVACGSSPCKVQTPTFSPVTGAHANQAVVLEFDAIASGDCGADGPDFAAAVTDENFATLVAETDMSRDDVADGVKFHGRVSTTVGAAGNYTLFVNVSQAGTTLAEGNEPFTVAP